MFVVSTDTWPSHARTVLISTPARRRCVAVVCRLCLRRHSRHGTAIQLLLSGVDRSLIALWLGHQSVETTQIYLDANLAMKESILKMVTPVKTDRKRFR